ncbi:MAG: VOC family protein [Bacteroidota bacterium]
MQKISPCLWFDDNAEEAVNFYLSIFKDSSIDSTMYYGDEGPGKKGSVMAITFRLFGQSFMALNGGPHYTFSPAISFFVNCKSQSEINELWDKLSDGGKTQQCGWLQDKFGVSWQIVPDELDKLLMDSDEEKVRRVTRAMLQMERLDIERLKQAYEEE